MNANVIDINKFKAKREEDKFDELVDESEKMEEMIIDIATSLAVDVSDTLHDYGFNVTDNARAHDIMMVIEAIRSLAYSAMNEDFPLQDISESMFEFEDEEEFKRGLLEE